MNICYIVTSRMPSEKAHGFQIAKTCEELALLGEKVTLLVPNRKTAITKDVFDYYSVKRNFTIQYVRVFDFFALEKYLGRLAFILQSISFALRLSFLKLPQETVIITRNPEIVWVMTLRGFKTIYSAHNWPERKRALFLFFMRRVSKVIANSHGTARPFLKHGFTTVVVPNGVDIASFDAIAHSKDDLRKSLGLPLEKKIAMYVGHLYSWKGAHVVMAAAEQAAKEKRDIVFVFVGGTASDLKKYQSIVAERHLSNVLLVGHQEKKNIPHYIKAADVLLLPNTEENTESVRYTSPIKMFEYMASGVPIVASNLPSLREVLDDATAFFVKPGDVHSLLHGISAVFSNSNTAQTKAKKAYEKVQEYTWSTYAKKVLPCISSQE